MSHVPAMRIAGDAQKRLPRRFTFTITSLSALTLPAGKSDLWVYDAKTPHLAFRIRGTVRAFYFIRRDGKMIKRRLGAWGEITIDQARDLVGEYNGDVARGIHPIEERRRQRELSAADKLTLRAIWDEFHADKLQTRKASTVSGYKKYMEGPLKDWLDQPVKMITRDIVLARHRQLKGAGASNKNAAYANACMRVLRAVFNFAVALGRVTENPASVLAKRWYHVPRRTTKIPDDKLADWFTATATMRTATIKSADGKHEIPDETARLGADYLELALFTGMRRNEACQLRWDRVDFEARTLTVTDTKNGKPLVLPLSEHLLQLLNRRRGEAGRSPWVFPSPGRKGDAYFTEPRYAIARLTKLSGIKHTTHDLRRTFVTAATRQVPHAVAKLLVNHAAKSDDITQDYVTMTPDELRPHVEKIAQFFKAASEAKDKST